MPRLDDVIADILPEAQNAPADVLKKAMIDAARTLCRRSKVWRVDVEGTLIPGIAQVNLNFRAKRPWWTWRTSTRNESSSLPGGSAPLPMER